MSLTDRYHPQLLDQMRKAGIELAQITEVQEGQTLCGYTEDIWELPKMRTCQNRARLAFTAPSPDGSKGRRFQTCWVHFTWAMNTHPDRVKAVVPILPGRNTGEDLGTGSVAPLRAELRMHRNEVNRCTFCRVDAVSEHTHRRCLAYPTKFVRHESGTVYRLCEQHSSTVADIAPPGFGMPLPIYRKDGEA